MKMKSKGIKIIDFLFLLLNENYKIQNELKIDIADAIGMSNLQTQKLAYFVEGSFMAKFNEKIINENFEAWKYGPVLEELYQILKQFGKDRFYIRNEDFVDFNKKVKQIEKKFTNEQLEFIERIFIYFSKFSAFELVTLSHIEGPWEETLSSCEKEISDEAMVFYFKQKLAQIEQLI